MALEEARFVTAKRCLCRQARHTLCVQEVCDGHRMGGIGDVRCLEHLFNVRFGLDAHVLLSESLGLLLEVGVLLRLLACAPEAYRCWVELETTRSRKLIVTKMVMRSQTHQLLRERDLLELHLVDAGACGAHQGARREEDRRLHDEE